MSRRGNQYQLANGMLPRWDMPAAKWRVSIETLFGWTRIGEFVLREDAQRFYQRLLEAKRGGAKLEAL